MADSKFPTLRISAGARFIDGMCLSLVAAALVCGASPALAASKARLTGFNGIKFETPFAAAKQRLGAKARADKSPSTPKTNILLQSNIPLYGEALTANYTFGTDDRLKIVYAIVVTPKKDPAVCMSQWQNVAAGLKGAFGAPNTSASDATYPQTAEAKYAFANGAKLEANLWGCILMLVYTAPGYRKE